jgi:parallel beta-helix repeat protein
MIKNFRIIGAFGLSCCLVVLAHGIAHAATLNVTSSADSGPNTLRAAIAAANASPGMDTITFSVPGPITLSSELDITDPIAIEGGGVTLAAAASDVSLLVLTGASGGSLIRGLAVIQGDSGLLLSSDGNTVLGCAVGTNWLSGLGLGNSLGIQVTGSNNVLGNGTPGGRNLISGNTNFGIIQFSGIGLRIQGNYIGTNANGTAAVPNSTGVSISDADSAMIGGDQSAQQGNLISSNLVHGIYISGAASGNTVCGNVIGLNAAQTGTLPNQYGVTLFGGQANAIGLPLPNYGNLISGNSQSGVWVVNGGSRHSICNNLIGTTAGGASGLGNVRGIYLNSATKILVGGDTLANPLARNIISGNSQEGIYLNGNSNTVAGNYIGTDPSGSVSLTNGSFGVQVAGGDDNCIGGPANGSAWFGNVISGNSGGGSAGIAVSTATHTRIQGNYIGLNAGGNTALPNRMGIYLSSAGTLIGGATASAHNVIAANVNEGILIFGAGSNTVAGNYIGTNAGGQTPVPNGSSQITLWDAPDNVIGGSAPADCNVLCGASSMLPTLNLRGSGTTRNTVLGNFINVLADGSPAGVTALAGVYLWDGAHDNLIGQKAGLGNCIARHDCGIGVQDAGSIGNGLFTNTICAFANPATGVGIGFYAGNNNHPAPAITLAAVNYVGGTATAGDYIEIFLSDRGAGKSGGSLRFLGTAMADGNGAWSLVPGAVSAGAWICATATDNSDNTSPFSPNVQVTAAILTPTPSFTPILTPTSTPSMTPSPTATSTISPTPSVTSSRSTTPTISPTSSNTPTSTITPSQTLTATPPATPTPSPTLAAPLAGVDLGGKATRAFPQPAKDRVQFLLHLDQAAEVKIAIYNLLGERVVEIAAGLPAGRGQVLVWDCRQASPGIYLARIYKQGKYAGTVKIAVVR